MLKNSKKNEVGMGERVKG